MTEYIDRTQEPDDVFEREVLARVEDPTPPEMLRERLRLDFEAELRKVLMQRVAAEFAGRLADAALAVFRGQQDPAVQRVLELHTRSWFRIGPETEPRHDGQTCAHCNQYWGTAGCPTVRAIKDVDLLGRPVQCDGICHEATDGSDADCARCNSGEYDRVCDDCRYYMASDR